MLKCPLDVAGDVTEDELEGFFTGHYSQVLRVVTLVTGSRSAAEDAVHEALARAWEHRGPIDHLDRWVLTVALNLARNRWRKLRREVLGRTVDRPSPERPSGVSVDLERALRALPNRQREVLVLHYLLDLSVAQVADLLRLSPGGVKNALHRGRASLATVLTTQEVP